MGLGLFLHDLLKTSNSIGSNWYMDTGVRDLEDAFFKANST